MKRLLVLALVACHPAPAAKPAPATSGWFCYHDTTIGTSCYRAADECHAFAQASGATTPDCTASATAFCVSYTWAADGSPRTECLPTQEDCDDYAGALVSEAGGPPVAASGSIEPCKETR